jgi:SAM-dependent methyltransferase
MGTQYDDIGESYERVKLAMPLALHPERATFEALTADAAGRAALDLACGTGWYSRLLRRSGAASVTGVDISAEMVGVAEHAEAREPLGNRYLTGDVRKLGVVGEFELVTAVWLLCYARDRADLAAMAATAYANLAPGGRYAGVEMNPRFDWNGPPATRYGLTHRSDAEFSGGRELTVTAHVDPPITFQACFWEEEPIATAFSDAGFTEVEFVPATLPVDPDDGFWDDFRKNPTIVGVRALK